MNTEENMPRVSISMTKKQLEKLDAISKKKHRKRSEQIIHMMEFYIQHKKRYEKDLGDLTELSSDLRGQ